MKARLRRNAAALMIVALVWVLPALAITMGWLRIP